MRMSESALGLAVTSILQAVIWPAGASAAAVTAACGRTCAFSPAHGVAACANPLSPSHAARAAPTPIAHLRMTASRPFLARRLVPFAELDQRTPWFAPSRQAA